MNLNYNIYKHLIIVIRQLDEVLVYPVIYKENGAFLTHDRD